MENYNFEQPHILILGALFGVSGPFRYPRKEKMEYYFLEKSSRGRTLLIETLMQEVKPIVKNKNEME